MMLRVPMQVGFLMEAAEKPQLYIPMSVALPEMTSSAAQHLILVEAEEEVLRRTKRNAAKFDSGYPGLRRFPFPTALRILQFGGSKFVQSQGLRGEVDGNVIQVVVRHCWGEVLDRFRRFHNEQACGSWQHARRNRYSNSSSRLRFGTFFVCEMSLDSPGFFRR